MWGRKRNKSGQDLMAKSCWRSERRRYGPAVVPNPSERVVCMRRSGSQHGRDLIAPAVPRGKKPLPARARNTTIETAQCCPPTGNGQRLCFEQSSSCFSLNLLTAMSHGGVNDPLQRSRLKIQFAFCLGIRYASHLSPVVNRI